MRRLLAPTLLAAILVVAAACGDDDTENTSSAARDTIDVAMVDNAYEPTEIEVPVGEEITFVFDNGGAALHEAYIGDEEAQEEHAMAMAEGSGEGEMDGMDHGGGHEGDDAEVIEVEPGDDGRLSYTFDEPGEYLIGCHQPGHYEDGMKLQVTAV